MVLFAQAAPACQPTDSWVCEAVFDRTQSTWWAHAAEWFVSIPLAIIAILLAAWLINRIVRRMIKRSMQRMLEPGVHRPTRWLRDKSPEVLLRTQANNLRTEARVQTLST